MRAPTPSAAAELVVPSSLQWLAALDEISRQLVACTRRQLQTCRKRHGWLSGRLAQTHPGVRLRHQAQRLDDFEQRLKLAARRALHGATGRLHSQTLRLGHQAPLARIRDLRGRCLSMTLQLRAAAREQLALARSRIELAMRGLHSVSPLATLDRGYAIVTRHPGGELLRSADEVTRGDRIEARLAVGRVRARVEETDK